jgi:hypothetical protein
MRSLPKPNFSARSVLQLCADNVRSRELSSRLYSVVDEINNAEVEYNRKGEDALLCTVPQTASVGGIVTKEEMEKLYIGTFSRQGSKVRPFYDKIKLSPKHGICPLCGQRIVKQLDHYLPKAHYPVFAVTPLNLVPSCSDCNKDKSALKPNSPSEQTFHPYFDETDDDLWLDASVLEDSPPVIVFTAKPPENWPEIKRNRVCFHFKVLNLGNLYSSHAAAELMNLRYGLTRIAERGGTEGLKNHLAEQAEDRMIVAKNSWQASMYKALSESDWFIEVGYEYIT